MDEEHQDSYDEPDDESEETTSNTLKREMNYSSVSYQIPSFLTKRF